MVRMQTRKENPVLRWLTALAVFLAAVICLLVATWQSGPWFGRFFGLARPTEGTPPNAPLVELDTFLADPAKYTGQRLALEGFASLDGPLVQCPETDDGQPWCLVSLIEQGASQGAELMIQVSADKLNALTPETMLRDGSGSLLLIGSLIRASGIVVCEAERGCRLQVERLEPIDMLAQSTSLAMTASPVATLAPTFTPVPTFTPIPACYDVADVKPEHVGQILCVQGIAMHAYKDENVFYIRFSESNKDFFLLSYGWIWEGVKKGTCVRTVGEVKKLGAGLVIVIDAKGDNQICGN